MIAVELAKSAGGLESTPVNGEEKTEKPVLTDKQAAEAFQVSRAIVQQTKRVLRTQARRRRSISRVGHPLPMKTMIKYHASAEAEMLPAEGPAKIMTIGQGEYEAMAAKAEMSAKERPRRDG